MTARQQAVLAKVRAAGPAWYRAGGHGERVTLASLWRRGALERRVWRGAEGHAAAAHEYRVQARRRPARPVEEAAVTCAACVNQHGADARLRRSCGVTGCECWCNR